MDVITIKFVLFLSMSILLQAGSLFSQDAKPGLFSMHGDIGDVRKAGAVEYDARDKTYLVTGAGENMWFNNDAFHFVWKQASGDVSLAADIRWIGDGVNPHRKACLLIRQSLDSDSAYVDAAVHGDGLTSIQYRQTAGGLTREIQSNVKAPHRVRIEKEGDYVFMSVAGENEPLQPAGGCFKITFKEPFFIGLGVCSHEIDVLEKAVFSNVEITSGKKKTEGEPVPESTLETISIASLDRRVIYHTRDHIEAPNWSRDGKDLIFNGGGLIYKIPVTGGKPELIDTGFAKRCNNDHGLSPDGKQLVISDQTRDESKSIIYILPAAGGTPKQVTPLGPSYWHGWSPDGKTLAYCAQRGGEYDIYTIPVEGGEETRLTTAPGLDDGPDYSYDGEYIYFNSVRTGAMQIWRMKTDGSEQTQLTSDEFHDWFPHPSPDGKWIVFVSYEKDVQGHPANKDVMLRMMPAAGGNIQILAKLFGGQGTINVPSWSPDSTNLAFVSYRLVKP
ncbi:MAG: TolB family protein [Sedimentisphaerales bacterium]|nr:TolB family protein [Sedimentisphaerales bacterium]